ncbi:MAG: prepilin-type N-terminal cleavage/methylation domain-containing protein [Bacteroidota bacterium]
MKYKGFTLIEMSLALSLMGILMLVGTEVWGVIGQIHSLYMAKQHKEQEALILRYALAQDLFYYPDWRLGDQAIYHIDEDEDTIILYVFQADQVIRQQRDYTDTFRFSLYVQPFEQEAVLSLIDSSASIWFQQKCWSLAHAKP